MLSLDLLASRLADPDPWIGVLISDPRAALHASLVLRASGSRLDGPFLLRDGKAGRTPVTICVTEPGGAGAWFAGAKLLTRRIAPTWLVGFTPAVRLDDDPPGPDGAAFLETLDLDPLTQALRRIESTATDAPPSAAVALARGIVPVSHRSALASPPGEHPAGEKKIEKSSTPGHTPAGDRELEAGCLGCWTGGTLRSRAAARWLRERYPVAALDRESAGLADAAGEDSIPWAVFGSFVSFDDPALRARRDPSGDARPGLALSRFLETLATASV